jgi:hypothetical protein
MMEADWDHLRGQDLSHRLPVPTSSSAPAIAGWLKVGRARRPVRSDKKDLFYRTDRGFSATIVP